MDERTRRGRRAEAIAARHLLTQGYQLVEQNWSCPGGELDLVVTRADEIVFVEVRSASTRYLDSPSETVTAAKQARVARAADAWLRRHPEAPPRVRFDVIAVGFRWPWPAQVEHIEDAFTAPWAF
ncbi:MAG: YraN family protein [Myxococcales bacterium]|nr:YraN family protein [Myxococcales bacterium]MCB9545110.1 YraN family protein [Myxococcales bacterium]